MESQIDSRCNRKLIPGFFAKISVEPTMFLYMLAFQLTSVIEQVFFVYKACHVDHGYSEEICRNIEKYENIKIEVQKTVAIFYQWEGIASRLIPIVLALFLGPWSDKHGRKIWLLMGLLGKFIYSIMIIVNAKQFTWPLSYVIYTATIPCCLTGADMAIFASCYAYLSDITTVEDRTLRITILDASYLTTMPVGVAIGSQLYKVFDKSFSLMFTCNVILMVLAIIYSVIFLEWKTTDAQKTTRAMKNSILLLDFFDKNHLLQSINTMTKKREGNKRAIIWLLLITMSFYTFQRNEVGVLFLFTQLKLNWDTYVYSWFRTYQSAAFLLIMLIGMRVMTKVLKWSDTVLVSFGSLSNVLGRIFFVMAQTSWMMYLGASVASLGPITASVIRSILSKLLPITERGVIFAVLSVFDNAVPVFSATIYSQVYNATIETYPASIFWLTLATQAMVFILILIVHFILTGSIVIQDIELKTKIDLTVKKPEQISNLQDDEGPNDYEEQKLKMSNSS